MKTAQARETPLSRDSLGPEQIDSEPAEESCLNPLWIEVLPGGEAALEIPGSGVKLGPALRALFRRVEELPAESWGGPAATTRIPFQDRTFDLVTLYGKRPSTRALGEIVRVLKPSGVLYLAAWNRWWFGRFRKACPRLDSGRVYAGPRLAGLVRSAGFSVVRQYYVDPSLAQPRDILPAYGPSLRAHEILRWREGEAGRLRVSLACLRMSWLLYSGRIIVARV